MQKKTTVRKKKKPAFNVPNLGFFKSVKARWRKPRGVDNKKRIRKKFMGAHPRVGYKNTPSARGLHPLGSFEMLVHNETELMQAKESKSLVRFAGSLGGKKRAMLMQKAQDAKLIVLNAPVKTEAKKPKETKK